MPQTFITLIYSFSLHNRYFLTVTITTQHYTVQKEVIYNNLDKTHTDSFISTPAFDFDPLYFACLLLDDIMMMLFQQGFVVAVVTLLGGLASQYILVERKALVLYVNNFQYWYWYHTKVHSYVASKKRWGVRTSCRENCKVLLMTVLP